MLFTITLRILVLGLCIAAAPHWIEAGEVDERFLVPAPTRRIALVIGVEHYSPCGRPTTRYCLPDVRNAWNDANEVARALTLAGFSPVRVLPDPQTDDDIYDYVKDLARLAGPMNEPVVIAVFFAGHGFQLENKNYIALPNATEDDLTTHAVPLENIVAAFAGREAGMAMFFFDSCRTDISMKAAGSPGFTHPKELLGTVQVFATQFDQTASSAADDNALNSPYSIALMKYIPFSAPDFSFAKALDKIRVKVSEQTVNKRPPQVPIWISNASTTGFYFLPTAVEEAREAALWSEVLDNGTAPCVRSYKASHPGSAFLKRAIEWLAQPPPAPESGLAGSCPE